MVLRRFSFPTELGTHPTVPAGWIESCAASPRGVAWRLNFVVAIAGHDFEIEPFVADLEIIAGSIGTHQLRPNTRTVFTIWTGHRAPLWRDYCWTLT